VRSQPWLLPAVMLLGTVGVAGVQTNIDSDTVGEALTLIRSGTPRELTSFNQPYRIVVTQAPVDYAEIVTPFRRIVLAGIGRAATGDRGFGQKQAIDLLAESGERLDIYVEMTFHPQNTYVSVPDYTAALIAPDGRRITSETLTRVARWTTRLDGPPAVPPPQTPAVPRGNTLLGATVVGRFDLEMLDPSGAYELVVGLSGEDLARAKIALANMR
jgi:hypothetical protein